MQDAVARMSPRGQMYLVWLANILKNPVLGPFTTTLSAKACSVAFAGVATEHI
jgi:hypothetical protein